MNLFLNTGVSVQYSQVKQSLFQVDHTILSCHRLIPCVESLMVAERRPFIPSQGCQELLPGRLSNHCASWGVRQPGIGEKENRPRHQPSRGSSKQPDGCKTSNTICASANCLERHLGQTVHFGGSYRSFTFIDDLVKAWESPERHGCRHVRSAQSSFDFFLFPLTLLFWLPFWEWTIVFGWGKVI